MDKYTYIILLCTFFLERKLTTLIRYFDLVTQCLCDGSKFENNYHNLHQKYFMTKRMRRKLKRQRREEEILSDES